VLGAAGGTSTRFARSAGAHMASRFQAASRQTPH
jgi:hypothetical protein